MTTPGGWVNPIGKGLKSGRIDMGVDYTGTGSLYAMGPGVITNVYNAGWPGGKFIGLQLDSGQYMYYAENIIPSVQKGQRVQAGQLVGTAVGTYPYIEVGWAAPPGSGETMAAQSGQSALGQSQGDPGKYSTAYGVSMSNTIQSLGGPAGVMQPGGVQGTVPANYGTGTQLASSGGTLSGCVPMAWMVWYALRYASQLRRNLSRREFRNRRSQDGKRQQSRRQKTDAASVRSRTRLASDGRQAIE